MNENDHYKAALEIAAQARDRYLETPTAERFRVWRDASAISIKWHRALGSEGRDNDDDDLERLLSTK